MALVAYLDASGTAVDTPVLAVAGFVATEEQWDEFERAWAAALADEGVGEVHMKHLVHWRGEFEHWDRDEDRRARFVERLTGIMKAHTVRSFGASLAVEDFKAVNGAFQLSEKFGGPYAATAIMAFGSLLGWRDRERPGEVVDRFVVERGDAGQGEMYEVLRRIGRTHPSDPLRPVPPVTSLAKRWTEDGVTRYRFQFQACDFLAWEMAKAHRTALEAGVRIIRLRRSLAQLVTLGENALWGYARTEHLMGICRRFGIPPRNAQAPPAPTA